MELGLGLGLGLGLELGFGLELGSGLALTSSCSAFFQPSSGVAAHAATAALRQCELGCAPDMHMHMYMYICVYMLRAGAGLSWSGLVLAGLVWARGAGL